MEGQGTAVPLHLNPVRSPKRTEGLEQGAEFGALQPHPDPSAAAQRRSGWGRAGTGTGPSSRSPGTVLVQRTRPGSPAAPLPHQPQPDVAPPGPGLDAGSASELPAQLLRGPPRQPRSGNPGAERFRPCTSNSSRCAPGEPGNPARHPPAVPNSRPALSQTTRIERAALGEGPVTIATGAAPRGAGPGKPSLP